MADEQDDRDYIRPFWQRNYEEKPLTIFCAPRKFGGIFKAMQESAIRSWKILCPNSEIMLFGDEEGTKKTCEEFGIRHIPGMNINSFGTPYVNELFVRAQELAESDVLAWINSDIVLTQSLEPIVQQAKAKFPKFLMVARRWDLWKRWVPAPGDRDRVPFLLQWIDFKRGWRAELEKQIAKYGKLRHPGSSDCFIFTKELYSKQDFPPYLLGRYYWDGWLIYEALRQKATTIDISAINMVHLYHKRGKFGGFPHLRWMEERTVNENLCDGRKTKVNQCEYILQGSEIRKRS